MKRVKTCECDHPIKKYRGTWWHYPEDRGKFNVRLTEGCRYCDCIHAKPKEV